MIKLINDDCMNILKDYDDNYFDLAIVDPPYKDQKDQNPTQHMRKNAINSSMSNFGNKPDKFYFDELFRVSKNQIIWGGNYFLEYLHNTSGMICWNKHQPFETFSDFELAWTSFDCIARIFDMSIKEGNKTKKIHPTQKPIKLYNWLLHNYAKKGQKILDTHLGSGSIAISCYDFGVDLVGIEINELYFKKAKERISNMTLQIGIF